MKARKCGRFWVFARVPTPGKQSIWRQCLPSARKQSTKKLPNRPGFTHVQDLPRQPDFDDVAWLHFVETTNLLATLVARAIRNAIRANRFARIIRN